MFDELLAHNRARAAGFDLGHLTTRPARQFSLVTCMDCRIDPLSALGLRAGDVVVLRNAGGRITADAQRSLVLATTLLGVNQIAVMHHTGCALADVDEATVRRRVSEISGIEPDEQVAFLAMPDPDEALHADVEQVLADARLPAGLNVAGWRYDVATGLIESVVAPRMNR
jgi:carbonic anhydrase